MDEYTVLGVHDGHCSSAALLVDGVIRKAAQEERFVNIKNEPGMPVNAIAYCLGEVERLDEVALATRFIHEPDWYRKQEFWEKSAQDYYWNKLTWPLRRRIDPYFRNRLSDRKKLLNKVLGNIKLRRRSEEIKVVEHHAAHAASAFYGSHYEPGEKVLVITADGSGDGLSATVSMGYLDGTLIRLNRHDSTRDESIGEIYSLTTYYLGFKPWEHEYKLMGLAPYSQSDSEIINGLFSIMGVSNGRFTSKLSADFAYDYLKRLYYKKRFDRICASLQFWFEHMMFEWISELIIEIGYPAKIACAGGDFMNVKANQIIAQQSFIEDMFIFPSSGDESTSIGACMHAYADYCIAHDLHPKREIKAIGPLYLGPPTGFKGHEDWIKTQCAAHGWSCWEEENIADYIVELLSEGKIVARCSGNLEFGARALGNRTILADGSDVNIKTPLNAQIKHRDFWMPFAPSILEGEDERLIHNPNGIRSPYMIMAYDSTEAGRKELAAAMHPYDFTLRPQIVERDWNPDYWDILQKWHRRSGCGGLLNTSFNVHGSPIVKDWETAFWTMEQTGLENLVIENLVIKK